MIKSFLTSNTVLVFCIFSHTNTHTSHIYLFIWWEDRAYGVKQIEGEISCILNHATEPALNQVRHQSKQVLCSQKQAGTIGEDWREEAKIEKSRWAEGVKFRAFKGAQLVRLGSIHPELNLNCKLEQSIETEGRIVEDRAMAREAKLSWQESREENREANTEWVRVGQRLFLWSRRLLTQALIFSFFC